MIQINKIDTVDVILAEGTLPACYLALEMAKKGLRVAVVSGGASLAPEITTTLRLWTDPDDAARSPGVFGRILTDALRPNGNGSQERLWHAGKLSESLEDTLIEAGVTFYYRAQPVGIAVSGTEIGGLIVAGKFGVGLIAGPTVFDCTPLASVARIAGAGIVRRSPGAIAMTQVVHLIGESVPTIPAGGVTLAGAHGPLLEYEFQTDADPQDPLFLSNAALDARRAILTADAGLPGTPLRSAEQPIYNSLFSLSDSASAIGTVGGYQGLALLGPTIAAESDAAQIVASAARSLQFAADYAEAASTLAIGRRGSEISGSLAALVSLPAAGANTGDLVAASELSLGDRFYREPDVGPVEIDLSGLPSLLSGQLVVTGGGTCGVGATVEGARSGLDTICLEANADLGGAHTVGGVSHFWFGRWPTHMVEHYLELKRISTEKNLPWGIAQLALAGQTGARIVPLAPAAGVAERDGIVRGVVVATAAGLGVVGGDYFIDSTGDGDVATWAGAPYTYGAERDEITLWFSFGKFSGDRNEVSRTYRSVADQRGVRDTSRAIVSSKRMLGIFGEGEFPQFNIATRETRHIRGRDRLSYADVLSGKRVSEVILVYRSNVDIKGMASSDEALTGFVERDYVRNWWCQIPYGAIVPQRLSNVLVIGKAYSASHDALSMARMQADITDMGAVAGMAAGFAHKSGTNFPDLNVSAFQQVLLQNGILEPADLPGAKPMEEETGLAMLECLVDRALTGPMELDEQMRLASGGQKVVPFLEEAITHDVKGNYMKAIASQLALQRSTAGSHILLKLVEEAISEPELPQVWKFSDKLRPDHGWAADATYLINALGLSGERRVIPLLDRMVDKLDLSEPPVTWRFNYVHSVSYVLERLADPQGVPIIKRLLWEPVLHNRVQPRGSDWRDSADYTAERCAYLELCLGRALARCGDAAGYEVLISYTQDHRMFLARSAMIELIDITGEDHGFDGDAWRTWLASRKESLQPVPFTRKID